MEQLDAIFTYSPTHCIVICKTHYQGILQSQLRSHLNSKHKELTPKTRRQIVLAAASFRGWAKTEDEVVFPEPEAMPILFLPVYRNAFMCVSATPSNKACGHINQQLKHIQEHCRDKHGWKNPRQRGRQAQGSSVQYLTMWVEGIACQKFQNTGRLGRLFAVSQPQPNTHMVDREDEDIRRAVTASLSQATMDAEEREKEQHDRIEMDRDRYMFNAWLHRAGWAEHLKGYSRSWLLTTMKKPAPHEKALDRVCWALQMVIYRAQQSSRPSVVGMPAMTYIGRREMGGTTNEKLFHAEQTGKTMVKYSGWWLEIMRYIWRTYALPEISIEEREGEEEVQGKRPPYRLTALQAGMIRDIQAIVGRDVAEGEEDWFEDTDSDDELDEEQEEMLEASVLRFVLHLLDHPLGDNEYTSALISAMAVMGIDANSGWISPLLYTPKQAAVVSVSRMLVLYGATQMRKTEIAQLEAEGIDHDEAEEKAHSHFDCVQQMTNRFMTLTSYNGQPTPMDAILRLKAYGMKIRFNTSAEGVIDWVDDTLLYGHIRFSMPQLRSMIHGVIARARQHLMKTLLLLQVNDEGEVIPSTTALPLIYWDRLVDNPAEQKMGWSFMEDARNQEATDVPKPPLWLGQRVIEEKLLREAFIDAVATRDAMVVGGPAVWNADRVKQYRQDKDTFCQDLAVVTHGTYGFPARVSELLTISYKNSANGESRGVFIENGLLGTVTMYHKNIGSTQQSKVIYRFLPREVGELMVYYLWFVLPFWEKIEGIVRGKAIESSAYIWPPEPEKEWKMPQRKRQAAEDSEEGELGAEEDRSEATAIKLWNANHVKYAMQKTSLEYMGVKLTIMAWRHASKAIYRRYIVNKTAVKTYMQADEEGSRGEEEDEAADLQTGHSSHVGGLIYGRHITEAAFSTESKRAAFRRVSKEWHAFLYMSDAIETQSKRLRTRAARKEAIEEEYRRWKMMRQVDIDGQLRKLMGEQAAFRSVQKPALQAIMRQESPVVVIMGTGAGKSLLFMLPASVSTGVTVVIVPLVSLRGNMRERCCRLGITCVEWSSRRPSEWAQVVLVTPESAVGEAFGQYLNRQRAMGRLDRIVVDECHVILDSLQGWRARMLALRGLVMMETQVVYLTATLRPSEEAQFIQLMGLPGKEQCQWFRGNTTRPNIQYQVFDYNVEKEEEEVEALVAALQRRHPHGQVVVYCSSVAKTVRLAEVLQCVCYHRNIGSQGEKERLVEQLASGSQRVLTATNALGLGVDARTIRAVVHVGAVRKVRHYAQESGRAGRDGKASEAIIMRGFRATRRGITAVPFPRDAEEDIVELIGGDGCIREVLDKAMDGREERKGCEQGEERCQRCERAGETTDRDGLLAVGGAEIHDKHEFERQMLARKSQADQVNWQEARDAIEVGQLGELMEEWKDGCQRCRAWGVRGDGHDIWSCKGEMAEEVRQGMKDFTSRKQWAKFSCCFGCGLPQSVCESFALDIASGGYYKQSGADCQYKGVLVEMVFSVWTRHVGLVGDMLQAAMEQDGWMAQTEGEIENGPGMGAIGRWFCEKKRWGGIEGNKMCWFIVQVMGGSKA